MTRNQYIIIIISCILIYLWIQFYSTTFTKSNIDNQTYNVRDMPDKLQAANQLALIKQKMITLVNYLQRTYPNYENVQRLVLRFKPDNINEKQYYSPYTSYTINKGEKIVFCLRDSEDKIHDLNTLCFVAIHELAHIMSESTGHNEEFRRNFEFLLKNAVSQNIYIPQDFKNNPQEYCGITITESPV